MNCNCQYRKPSCEAGRKLHQKMTIHFLKHGMDDKHMELWAKWEREHLKS
jgi:hypothetical protein